MKTVSPERWAQIEAALDAALDAAPADRPALLDQRCAGDPTLRAAVEGLLAAALAPTNPALDPGAVAQPLWAGLAAAETDGAPLPERFGPYRVLEEIGHGGMGTVFLAERDDDQYHKRVAIKVLRRGMARTDLVQRFRHERQILASLDHPGIARLLDGGIGTDGSPYLVMEYLEGEPLDGYCRDRQLPIATRLQLFEAVAEAVQYAHEQLVVHRDLKPSNILVTHAGQVKLLDFGIAKLLDESAAERPLTQTAMRVMTPEYAAPEQVRGGRISAATDVYALGVLLYELLAGQRPYSLAGRSLSEVERIICETEPPRPSAVVTRDATTAAAEPLRRRLRGDLDTITLKALQKDPVRRYHSVAAMLEDLQRYRDGRPVLARPDTPFYRAGKFARRHAAAVTAIAAVMAALAGAGWYQRELRARAEAEAANAAAAAEFLTSIFGASDPYDPSPERGREVTALALLDRGAERVDSALADNPTLQARMQTVLGRIYANLGLYDRAAPLLERAAALLRGPAAADGLRELGAVYIGMGRAVEAESLLVEAVRRFRGLGPARREALAAALDRLATSRQEQARYADAEPLFVEALALRRALHGERHLDVTESLNNLALIRWLQADYVGADSLYRRAVELRRDLLGPSHLLVAETMHNLATAQESLGHLDSAETLFRESLALKRAALVGPHPSLSVHLNNLGNLLRQRDQPAEAETFYQEALAMDLAVFGEVHPYVAAGLNNLGGLYMDEGRFTESVVAFERALEVNRRRLGEEHTAVALNLNNIGTVLLRQGEVARAEPYHRQAAERFRRLAGPEHPSTRVVAGNLAADLRELGRLDEAAAIYREMLPGLESGLPATRAQLATTLVGLGRTLTAAGRYAEADSLLARGLTLAEETYGPTDVRLAEARLARGILLAASGRPPEAAALLHQARETLEPLRRRQPRLARQAERAVANLR